MTSMPAAFLKWLTFTIWIFTNFSSSWSAQVPSQLIPFLQERDRIAFEFAVPIAECVARRDSRYPVFHGCIDWHSAVHGVWALTAYSRVTGDRRYVPLINSVLSPDLLKEERAALSKSPSFEMPYGRAWFLRLALEHSRTFETELLTDFADDIAKSLVRYYTDHPPRPHSREYENASWALLNLYEYAKHRGNSTILAFVENTVKENFWPFSDEQCPVLEQERSWPDFMAICTTWAWLMIETVESPYPQKWIDAFLPVGETLEPVTDPRSAHHHGLNFSRAWGLWGLYDATADLRLLDSFLDHFYQNYRNRDWWAGDYRAVGHWVAQFGMFALVDTY